MTRYGALLVFGMVFVGVQLRDMMLPEMSTLARAISAGALGGLAGLLAVRVFGGSR